MLAEECALQQSIHRQAFNVAQHAGIERKGLTHGSAVFIDQLKASYLDRRGSHTPGPRAVQDEPREGFQHSRDSRSARLYLSATSTYLAAGGISCSDCIDCLPGYSFLLSCCAKVSKGVAHRCNQSQTDRITCGHWLAYQQMCLKKVWRHHDAGVGPETRVRRSPGLAPSLTSRARIRL